MINVNLIALGKIKEKYFCDAANEYSKRLSAYCKLTVTEIEPVRLPDNPSQPQINAALEKEGAAVLKSVPAGTLLIALCIEGKSTSSEELSRIMSDSFDMGRGITFVIGSSYGLCDTVKNAAAIKLSMSEMTFPHNLARVMLLEQIYRAFKISEGGKYHK